MSHVDPDGLENLIAASGVSSRTAKKLRDSNGRKKAAVGQGAAEPPEISTV